MKKRRIGIIILVLAAVAAFLLWRAYFRKEAEEGVLLLSGNMEVTEWNIGFKIAGRVVERLVDEGDKVEKGQVLARLDDAELASIVTQNRAALREAESRLEALKAGSRPQEIEEAKANVRSEEAETVRLKRDFERAEILYKNGAISTAQYDAAKSAYETRAAQHRSAVESLSLVKEGPRKEDIDAARHRVEEAKAVIKTAEEKLKDTVITAPAAGVVLRKNIELGETVGAGVPIFTIGDLASPWIKVYVPEPQLTLVKLGQRAYVTVDTEPGKPRKTY
ncbi:MAG TPA: efflux RND transporter periplasmic adaptor subunit, partial [Syntrophorhabdales bacterium]|nr:efflux RND transporter periplasmic adaptor subunit [Syntrophorhabdales bacterium]